MNFFLIVIFAVCVFPVFANEQKAERVPASVFIFMDTNYGAIVSRYNLKVAGVEMPQIHGYRFVELSFPPGKYLIESERDGVGGTSLDLQVSAGEKHYLFIEPVGFPRAKPILKVVDEKRGLEGVRKSIEIVVPEKNKALLATKGIQVPSLFPSVFAANSPVEARKAAENPPQKNQVVETSSAMKESLPLENEATQRKQAEIDQLRAELDAARRKQEEAEQLRTESEKSKKKLADAEDNLKKVALLQAAQAAPPTSIPLSIPTGTPVLANRRALVIGNDTYQSVPVLANAREDARTIALNLSTVGYQVTLKLDLNEREMKAAIRNFAGQVQGGDEVLFFFAGHGVQLGAANYLLPTDIGSDSEAQVRDEAIQLQRILDDFSERKAKLTLAVLDACRDNPFKSLGRTIGGRGLAATTAATGQMVIFSAGTGQQALDKLGYADTSKNGLFTRVFVQEMQKPNVSIDRVMKSVRNQVAELAKTIGHEQVPAIYDQVLGDFYFKK